MASTAVNLILLLLALLALPGCSETQDTEKLIETAIRHQQDGDHSAASIELRNLLAIEPGHIEARRLLAISYNETNQPGAAEDEIRKAIEFGANPRPLRPILARSLLFQGKNERLLDEIFPDPSDVGPVSLQISALRGLAYLASGNFSEARTQLNRVVAQDPSNSDALLGLAGIIAADNQHDDAFKLIERALQSNPKSIDAWMLKANLLRMRKLPDEAITAYKQILVLQPANLNAHMQLTSLHIDAQRFDEASKHLEAVRSKLRDNALANYLFALIELRKKNYPAAKTAIDESLRANPSHAPTLLLAAAVEYSSGSFDAASKHLRILLERAPESITARRMLAMVMMQSGQTQRAIELLEQTLPLAPQDPQLLALMGEAHLQNADLERAVPYLERSAKADPKNSSTSLALQAARVLGGESARALADLEASMKVDTGSSGRTEILYVATLIHRRNFQAARIAIPRLEKNQPNNPVTHNLKAAILVASGDFDQARRSLESALALNPRFAPAVINLAKLDLRERSPRQAKRRLDALLERDPTNELGLTAMAELAPQIGITNDAFLEILERARRTNSNSMRTLVLLSSTHLRSGNPQRALEFAVAAQQVNPDHADVLDALATAQIASGRSSDALGTYSKLALQNPKSPHILHRLATAQAANNNTAGATITLRKALGIDPNHAPSIVLLAEIELVAGRPESASEIARDLQKRFPKLAVGYSLEGDALDRRKQTEQALKLYQNARSLGDRSARLAIKMHMAMVALRRTNEADAFLARYAKENPREFAVLAYMADASLSAGKFDAAIGQYQRVLEQQPDNALVLNNLAWASFKVNDKRARQYAEKAHKLAPDNPIVLDTYGWILAQAGEVDRATEVLQRAVSNAPDSRQIRFNYAQVLLKSGNYGRARRELDTVLSSAGPFEHEAEARELVRKLR